MPAAGGAGGGGGGGAWSRGAGGEEEKGGGGDTAGAGGGADGGSYLIGRGGRAEADATGLPPRHRSSSNAVERGVRAGEVEAGKGRSLSAESKGEDAASPRARSASGGLGPVTRPTAVPVVLPSSMPSSSMLAPPSAPSFPQPSPPPPAHPPPNALLLPPLPPGFVVPADAQHALLHFLSSTPLLHRPALLAITIEQVALLLAASAFSLPSCLAHLRALVDARRHFPSVPHLVHAISVALRDQTYVGEAERDAICAFLTTRSHLLSSPSSAARSLREAGPMLDVAFTACHHNVATFIGLCQRFDTAGHRFADARALCREVVAVIAEGVRPSFAVEPSVYQAVLTFLHMPAVLQLFTSPPALSSLNPTHPDLTSLLFEGSGLEGVKAALLRFVSLHRSFASLQELWMAVHIQWRLNLSSLCETRTALYDHLTSQCQSLVPTANVGHQELELLLVAGRGLHRTKQHCTRLHTAQLTFSNVYELARAFMPTLRISPDEQALVQSQVAQCAATLFEPQAAPSVSSLSPLQCAWLLYEAGSVMALQSYLTSFGHYGRRFSNYFDLLSSLQLAVTSQSSSAPSALFSLISFLLSSPGLLSCSLPVHSLTGRQLDSILLSYPIGPLLLHLSHFHTLQHSFSSVQDLVDAIHVAFTSGYHTSEAMRRTLRGYLTSSECVLFDSVDDSDMAGTLDVMIESSGSLPLCFHHLQQLQMLGMRYSHVVKAIPAIRHAMHTGAYSSTANITALLAYLTSPECSLLSLQASSHLSSLPASTVDQLLLTGGGLLNTIKHLTRLNLAQRHLPSFSHLISCVRIARRRRLYYSPAQREQLYQYLTSPACHFFADLTTQVKVSERDMERLFKYGGGVDATMRALEELNGARFRSFQHVMAMVKHFAQFDAKVREHERERRRKREVSAEERQEVVQFLRSNDCALFSEHPHALRVTAQEVDALVLAGQSSRAALQALRQLSEQGRKFLHMADLSQAVAALMGPNGVISLSKSQRTALLAALSYPQAAIFAGVPAIRLSESDLQSLVYCAGSAERVMQEVRAFDAVGRRFVSFVDFRGALQVSVAGGLHAREDERGLLREVLMGSCHALFGGRRSEAMQGDESEMEGIIKAGRGFLSALYFLQLLDESLQRFDSFPALLAALTSLAATQPVPPAFAALHAHPHHEQARVFRLLQSADCHLFADASDESDLLITPLAFDLLLTRTGGLQRALRVVVGLERLERRFMTLGELIFSTCKVSDQGVGIREIEEYAEGGEEEEQEEEEDVQEEEEDEEDGQRAAGARVGVDGKLGEEGDERAVREVVDGADVGWRAEESKTTGRADAAKGGLSGGARPPGGEKKKAVVAIH